MSINGHVARLESQNQRERLKLLREVTRSIAERHDVGSIFQNTLRTLEHPLALDFCAACRYEPTSSRLVVSAVGIGGAPLAARLGMTVGALIDIDQNGLSRCVRGQLVYEADVAGVPNAFPQCLARGGLNSMVAAPLVTESRVFGVLIAARRDARSFPGDECEFLVQLAEHLGLAVQQAALYEALQTQRAAAPQELLLGPTVSGIAHEINNAITPISIYSDCLLESDSTLSPTAHDYLQIIGRAIDDVAQIVARLRELDRPPPEHHLPVDLNRVTNQVIDLARARCHMTQRRGAVIELRAELAPDIPAISGVEAELREALINLVFNAVDAMPDGGTLWLRTRDAASPSGAGGGPVIEIAAKVLAGSGEDRARRSAEPFLTGNGMHGTGLGLAMVYGVLQRHGANLDIESGLGRGNCVRLSFAVPADQRGA